MEIAPWELGRWRVEPAWGPQPSAVRSFAQKHGKWGFERAQYPLDKEYTLNYRGLNIMIQAMFLNSGVLGSLGLCFLRPRGEAESAAAFVEESPGLGHGRSREQTARQTRAVALSLGQLGESTPKTCHLTLLLGGSWAVISILRRPISRRIWVMRIVLPYYLTSFITTHEPPSRISRMFGAPGLARPPAVELAAHGLAAQPGSYSLECLQHTWRF